LAYSRAKFFWGAIDFIHSDESPYTPQQTFGLGENGLPPGIGVRRAQLVFSRPTQTPPQDAMATHIDFLNMTAGQPDDTWTDADFSQLEGFLSTYVGSLAPLMHTSTHFDQIRWYRVGPGITPPNPAVRIIEVDILGTAASALPPQIAATVTLKVVPRRQWGRMYLPLTGQTALSSSGRFASAQVTAVANATDALFGQAQSVDMRPVVFSKVRGKAYEVEHLQVDDVPDVMRSRRFNEATLKVVRP
jgi:hypothetical protein